jgi:hypothetical protein
MLPSRAPEFDHAATENTRARLAALARARVMTTAIERPPLADELECRFVNTPVSGTTPKFDCTLDGGELIRVKYDSLELHAEVAATDLLTALGFATDDVYMTRRVRCYGCPRLPFHTRQIAERLHISDFFEKRLIKYDRYTDFDWVSVERRDARLRTLEFGNDEGWAFYELSKVDPALGGATRAEVDALRLTAVFLNHWDNKVANQRLGCLNVEMCEHPLAMLSDLGSTFGPKKVDLDNWSRFPVWSDGPTCGVSLKDMPYGGGTFVDVRISEAGRVLLSERLRRLDTAQVDALFRNARFENVAGWVGAFERRVDQIANRPPCPPTTA